MASFDPYREWLDIDAGQRPPDHYALLGLSRFERDASEIAHAADARKAKIRRIRPGAHLADWQRVLDELDGAKRCLTSPTDKEAYDVALRNEPLPDESVLDDPAEQAGVASSSIIAESEESYIERKQGSGSAARQGGDAPADQRRTRAAPSADLAAARPGTNPLPPSIIAPPPQSLTSSMPDARTKTSTSAASGNLWPPGMSNKAQSESESDASEKAPVESLTKNLAPPPMPCAPTESSSEAPVSSSSAAPTELVPKPINPAANVPAQVPVSAATSNPSTPNPSKLTASTASSSTSPGMSLLSSLSLSELLPPRAGLANVVSASGPISAGGEAVSVSTANLTAGAATATPSPVATEANTSAAISSWKATTSAGQSEVHPSEDTMVSPAPSSPAERFGRRRMNSSVQAAIAVSLMLLLAAGVVYVQGRGGDRMSVAKRDDAKSLVDGSQGPGAKTSNDSGKTTDDAGKGQPANGGGQPEASDPTDGTTGDPADPSASKPELTPERRPMPRPNPPVTPRPNPPPVQPPPVQPPTVQPPTSTPKPSPKPRPEPFPRPVPRPEPAPTPETPPESELTAGQMMQLKQAMRETRALLADRDLAGAEARLRQADEIAAKGAIGPYTEKLERLRLLTHYVSEFWGAVADGMTGLADQDFQVGNTVIRILDVSPDGIRYRSKGTNHTRSKREMHSALVLAIAEHWLDETPKSRVFVGAFMAVDPRYGVEKARQQWQAAMNGGAPIGELLPVLEDTY